MIHTGIVLWVVLCISYIESVLTTSYLPQSTVVVLADC